MYHFMLFPFGTKGLYTESIKSPACSYIRHKPNIQQQMATGGTRRYRTFILRFFRPPLRPHKLSTHMVRKMGLEPIRPCEHSDLNATCLPIPALSHMVGSGLPTSFKILFYFSTVVYNTNSQVL